MRLSPRVRQSFVDRDLAGGRSWARLAAMAAAGTVAAAGSLVALQPFAAAPAAAVTFQDGWDGEFASNQLWVLADDQTASPEMIVNPEGVSLADFDYQLRPAYDRTGADDGAACAGNWDALALGPLGASQGDSTLAQLGWDSATGEGGIVFAGQGRCYPVDGLAVNGVPLGGGEIAAVTGELVAVSPEVGLFDGDATTNNSGLHVLQIVNTGHPSRPNYQAVKLASATTGISLSGGNLKTAAEAAGKTGDLGGEWRLGADVALDGQGRPYRMARFDAPGTELDYWALLRFNLPRNSSGIPLQSGSWWYEVVKVFEDAEGGDVVGSVFVSGQLYTAHAGGAIRRWDPVTGAGETIGRTDGLADLAATGQTGVIDGAVFEDTSGTGYSSSRSTRLPGAEVELWREKDGQREFIGAT
ncbi:MAG: hypothetical protein LBD90_08225, partial [Bifidobacteriaceae bacterium]|nr:hypothetical protein [Bifidobacteriaceae bacterium]